MYANTIPYSIMPVYVISDVETGHPESAEKNMYNIGKSPVAQHNKWNFSVITFCFCFCFCFCLDMQLCSICYNSIIQ